MHDSSFRRMTKFREEFNAQIAPAAVIVEVGSAIIGNSPSYRTIFHDQSYVYIGLDVAPACGVHLVVKDPYNWSELDDGSVDLVISGQALEHVERPWLTMCVIARILKPGGLCCMIAPSKGREHKHPLDCYRFLPDGMRALAEYAGLEVLQCDVDEEPSSTWGDCCVVSRKP